MSRLNNKKSFTDIMYDNRFILLSFVCSSAIMLIVFIGFGLFPFGDITILRMDLYHQYGPLFSELYDRVTSGESLLYSWNTGLGSSFLGNYFNYLSSPIGFLVMLIAGHKNMPEAIAVMVLIKAALSAAAFAFYLKKSQKRSNYSTVGFAVLYSFCGWFIAYYWNIMWIDAMVLLPLVALGIERIIKNGRPALYITALALTMFSNYYMSFMMCVFAILYFLVYFISNYTFSDFMRFLKGGTMFAFASFCAAGLMAFALLPTFNILQETSATSGTFPQTFTTYFDIFDFIANHLASVQPTIRSSGDDVLPNVYCGILTLILVPLYVMLKSVSTKEKLAHITLLGLFLISFDINKLNYIWHGMHFPNDLPYRQSFMYSFLLLIIAYKTFTKLREIPNRFIAFSGFAAVALIVLAQELDSKNVNNFTVIISLVFVVVFCVVLTLLKDKRYQASTVSLLLLCCIFSEAVVADTGNYSMDQPKTNYASDYETFEFVKEYIDEHDESEFYRMELSYLRTRMDPAWYDYNGVSVFSSMAYEKVSKFIHKLGMYGNDINSYTYYPQTAVFNSLFGIKYVVNNVEPDILVDSDQYEKLYQLDKFTAYENPYALPIGYCVDTSVSELTTESSNPFLVQNELFEKATGCAEVMKKLYPTYVATSNLSGFNAPYDKQSFPYEKTASGMEASATFYFKAKSTANVYLFVTTTDGNDAETMSVSSENLSMTQDLSKKGYILDIGKMKKGETFSATVPVKNDNGTITFYAYYLDNGLFEDGYNILNSEAIEYTKFTDTLIEGTVSCSSTKLFMTTIPYDSGWEITVDGKKVPESNKVKIGDAFLGFYIAAGEHSISMKYTPTGLVAGIAISVVTLLILIAFCFIYKLRRRTHSPSYKTFNPIDNSWSEDILENEEDNGMDEIEKNPSEEASTENNLPVREIISSNVKTEIFTISEDEIINEIFGDNLSE
ncbi:MAG: YfhO family protein [Clostridia bacterium]|nr:YfhO family protein [Clostridia bacterium]